MRVSIEDGVWARRLRVLEPRLPGTLVVHEVYRSLQGEGTRAGLPCVFVRLAGCPMRCVYCDTPHAFHQGVARRLEELIDEVLGYGDRLVQITGGEPLVQEEVYPLMERLADAGRTVLLETGGGVETSRVDPRVCVILDVKTPGSGEVAANVWGNLDRLRAQDEVKFVVCDEADFRWSLEVIDRYRLVERVPVLISPAFGRVGLEELAGWILDSRLPLRMQVQLHKVIWGPDRRGV
ncbi:MAG: 7-carboxy-7-deazaguanine synthase [Isosphaeraceae bacterium]|jgi:7-carboxy-7-deazaguanine synthase|nr:MAG: 7-carboxy-7-deazaguanine synthase [Isosphaeraceae bacterium]